MDTPFPALDSPECMGNGFLISQAEKFMSHMPSRSKSLVVQRRIRVSVHEQNPAFFQLQWRTTKSLMLMGFPGSGVCANFRFSRFISKLCAGWKRPLDHEATSDFKDETTLPIEGAALAYLLHREKPTLKKISILPERKEIMASVLQLQKLNVTNNLDEMHIALISTYSGICPVTGNSADAQRFELE